MNTSTLIEDIVPNNTAPRLKVADAVWVATALLHYDSERQYFSREEIAEKTRSLQITAGDYKSIWRHVDHHCVANREPAPNRPRMLYDEGHGRRRLFKDGDTYSIARKGSPTHPLWEELPQQFAHLRDWYEQKWNINPHDPLSALEGTWTFGSAENYLRELREGWD
jgi:hypothetical protein